MFKFNKHNKETVKRIIKNPKASFGDISPLAIGLKRVLEIFLSMSLSHRSLIIQPAALIENAPIINIKYISNNLVIEFKKIGIVQRQGSNNSQLPIGLSNLPNLIHLCVVFGNLSHQPFSGMSVFIFIFNSKYMYKLLLLYMINKNNNENKIK